MVWASVRAELARNPRPEPLDVLLVGDATEPVVCGGSHKRGGNRVAVVGPRRLGTRSTCVTFDLSELTFERSRVLWAENWTLRSGDTAVRLNASYFGLRSRAVSVALLTTHAAVNVGEP